MKGITLKTAIPRFDKLTPGANVTIAPRDVKTLPIIAKPSAEDDRARADRAAAIERDRLARLRVDLLSRTALGRLVLAGQ